MLWCDSQGNCELPYKFIERQAKDTRGIVKFKLSCTVRDYGHIAELL